MKKRDLADIDAQVEVLRQQRERLMEDTHALSDTLEVCARIGAPVRRVPFDVLREIAIYHFDQYPVPTFVCFKSPFTGVCIAWRDAALLSPRLWTTLFVKIGSPSSLKDAAVIEWFKRSKGLPTTFYFDLVPPIKGPTPSRKDIIHFCSSISSSLAHLSHLGIRAESTLDLELLLKPPLQWAAAGLQQLDIRTDPPGFEIEDWGPFVLFKSLPPVTRLTLDSLPDMPATRNPSFAPWAQLTYLHCSGASEIEIGDWADLMDLTVNLQVASFSLTCLLGHPAVRRPPSTHPHLEHLSLRLTASCSSIPLYDIMQVHFLPRLKTLEFSRYDSDDGRWAPLTRPPTDPSHGNYLPDFAHLERLAISYQYDENLRPLLLRAPHLRTLMVDMLDRSSVVGHRLLRELSHQGNGEEHVVPLLSSLHIACSARMQPSDMDAFIVLIQAMRPAGDTLPCGCAFLEDATITVHGEVAVKGLTEHANDCRKRGGRIEILRDGVKRIARQIIPHLQSIDDVLCTR